MRAVDTRVDLAERPELRMLAMAEASIGGYRSFLRGIRPRRVTRRLPAGSTAAVTMGSASMLTGYGR